MSLTAPRVIDITHRERLFAGFKGSPVVLVNLIVLEVNNVLVCYLEGMQSFDGDLFEISSKDVEKPGLPVAGLFTKNPVVVLGNEVWPHIESEHLTDVSRSAHFIERHVCANQFKTLSIEEPVMICLPI